MENEGQRLDSKNLLKLLDDDGQLSRAIKGFEPREQQKLMMNNIIDAYNKNQVALIEAGTGTGKSVAYLLPAIFWALNTKEKTLISTHTINLQEQLLYKDIPQLLNALGITLKAVLVKGMSNYLCLRRLAEAGDERSLFEEKEREELEKIEAWGKTTSDGSLSNLPFKPASTSWERVCAENDTCNRNGCHFYKDCHFFKARKEAQEAQILIANHSMLFADLAYRKKEDVGIGEPAILPSYQRIVLDEAHSIEDAATDFFAARISQLQLLRILSRIAAEKRGKQAGKLQQLIDRIFDHYKKSMPNQISALMVRLTIDLPAMRRELNENIFETFNSFQTFVEKIQNQKGGDNEKAKREEIRIRPAHHTHEFWSKDVLIKTKKLIDSLKNYSSAIMSLEAHIKNWENEKLQVILDPIFFDLKALASRLLESASILEHFISEQDTSQKVYWIELQPLKSITNTTLVVANLDISEPLLGSLFNPFPTIILCSATMTTNQRFEFIRERLGLQAERLTNKIITENLYESPFDYSKQALLAIPTDLPQPSHPDFLESISTHIWEAIKASRGNAFVLFTSYSMLETCHRKLASKFSAHKMTLFKQGDDTRTALLNKFRTTDYSVLFGTDSFWQGVDVAGDALRCVIIVKLPFRVPTEPIVEARTEAILAQGGDPFLQYSIPNAIVKFKQGFGRLIRHKKDRGCIVCLDTRLITKNYGKFFLNSLPPCQQIFDKGESLSQHLQNFYIKTHYLVKK